MVDGFEKKILLITYYFPPSSAAGAHRLGNLTKMALEKGWKVDVLSIDEAGSNSPASTLNSQSDLQVFRIGHCLNAQLNSKSQCSTALKNNRRFQAVFWLLVNKFLSKYNQVAIGLNLYIKACQHIQRSNPCVVITSGPPFVLHKVGLKLKNKFTNLRWLADFRDPWVYPGDIQQITELSLRDKFRGTLERADYISVVTQGHYEFLQKLYVGINKPVSTLILAPNGSELDLYKNVATRPIPEQAQINIGHLGDITYTYRNPKALLGALAEVVPNHNTELALHFWAKITPYTRWNGESLDDMVRSYALGEHVKVHDFVPRSAALAYQRSLDVLVLYAMNQPFQIPSKAYDYLMADKPLLVICEQASETYKLLIEYTGVFFAHENSIESVVDPLESVIAYVEKLKEKGGESTVQRDNLEALSYRPGFNEILRNVSAT